MLTLTLLRHAKSDWSTPGQPDFERPLAPRGEKAAPRMGAYMARKKIVPELILCSTAVRARQTLDLVLPRLPGPPPVAYDDKLYLASASMMLARLRLGAGSARHVMMVGHDPGMHDLAVSLAGRGDAGDLTALAAKFPTAGLAVLTFEAKAWEDVAPAAGTLRYFMSPKRLDA